ncbi:MAG: hypothetical protein H6557_29245 [Lewinellaceae bacterium]|nr:hypothetical protein [Phaeodactylibacter sp.]MCB9040734.1 hypothetical protein [Lewinellaceae bacterium]
MKILSFRKREGRNEWVSEWNTGATDFPWLSEESYRAKSLPACGTADGR